MRVIRFAALAVLGLGLLSTSVHAIPEGWHKSLKDGLEASAKSGKPLPENYQFLEQWLPDSLQLESAQYVTGGGFV